MTNELIAKYSQDFSTDKSYGQLSVVEILRETVEELISDILMEKQRDVIEEKLLLFGLTCFDQGRTIKS
jgi:hypothetical protein